MKTLVKMLAAHYKRVAPNIFSKSDRLLCLLSFTNHISALTSPILCVYNVFTQNIDLRQHIFSFSLAGEAGYAVFPSFERLDLA
jgi:hypothetical protein